MPGFEASAAGVAEGCVFGSDCTSTQAPNPTQSVEFTQEQSMKFQRGSRGIARDGDGRSTPRPGRFTPRKETRYPFYRKLGGPLGRSGRVRKIWPSPGFDPRTVHPVASRYTDYPIPAPVLFGNYGNRGKLQTIDKTLPYTTHTCRQRRI